MKKQSVLAGLALCSILGACATVTRGTTEEVRFLSEPSGALMTTSTGMNCTTPCTMNMARKDSFQATFKLDGFEPQTIMVNAVIQGGGAAGVVGNAVVGGVVGVGVDAVSGAAYDLRPNPVSAILKPVGPAQRPGPAPRR